MASIPSLPNVTSGLAVPATPQGRSLNDTGQANVSAVASPVFQQVGNLAAVPLSGEELRSVVAQANGVLAATTSNQLHFSVDQATGTYVVQLVDQQTGKALRQFPSEQILAVAQAIMNMEGGSLVNHEI